MEKAQSLCAGTRQTRDDAAAAEEPYPPPRRQIQPQGGMSDTRDVGGQGCRRPGMSKPGMSEAPLRSTSVPSYGSLKGTDRAARYFSNLDLSTRYMVAICLLVWEPNSMAS